LKKIGPSYRVIAEFVPNSEEDMKSHRKLTAVPNDRSRSGFLGLLIGLHGGSLQFRRGPGTVEYELHVSRRWIVQLAFVVFAAWLGAPFALCQNPGLAKGWKKGYGWGWVWGKEDEVGALNALTTQSVLKALSLVKQGKVYDLGINYDRTSYKWPGHSPGEILTFRSPEGVKRQKDIAMTLPAADPAGVAWHSCALFISDNVATQIDGLGHITTGDDNHWYNGFKESDFGGNWGIRKADATSIPPIVTRAILIDVAGYQRVDALKPHTAVTVDDLKKTLEWERVDIQPGDAVFIRTGTLRYWGDSGGDSEKISGPDSAGINLDSAKWLVEEKGAILIGSDTSGLEVAPAPAGSRSFIPVHEYLLIQQGVHIGEFHFLEQLAQDKAYEFCYVATTNKIKGAVAGFTMRPIGLK
jgi:kynurenine formamidase